ncbi:MAG TPA: hypothetical protein VHN79_00180 [Lacunisphaera sp.]|nr:hypothetical protein [Lacunisphaera sp.]
MKRLLTPLFLLLILCGLTACSSTKEIIANGLRVEVTRVQRDGNGAIEVTWRVHNPNIVPYVFSKTTHKLSLDGTLIGTLEDTSPLGVPQSNVVERTGTLVPAGGAATQAIEQALARGTAAYRQDSSIWILIIDDELEKVVLNSAGTVPVTGQ